MSWVDKIISVHHAVTDQVSHSKRLASDRYFVWQEERAKDFIADGRHQMRAVIGTTDLFTKLEFDPWKDAFESALNDAEGIAWRLNSVDFEPDTGFAHYEWVWQVI